MARRRKTQNIPRIRKIAPPGSAPGHLQQHSQAPASINLISYNKDHYIELGIESFEKLTIELEKRPDSVNWVDITGHQDLGLLLKLADYYKLHKLAIEDVVETNQRAKLESYEDHVYLVLKMISNIETCDTEQLSIFLGTNFFITIQQRAGDCLEPVRERIRNKSSIIRSLSTGYLAYAVVDAVVDIYFPVLEKYADQLDSYEEKLLNDPEAISVKKIHLLKKELLLLKSTIWGNRDLLNTIVREEPHYFNSKTIVYIRDCYDHTIQQLDLVETYRSIGLTLMELSFSSADAKANEIMKVLTVVASIFIPLTFIAGIYGMNFNVQKSPFNMPELEWYFGYPFALMIMGLVAFSLLAFFRRKKWI